MHKNQMNILAGRFRALRPPQHTTQYRLWLDMVQATTSAAVPEQWGRDFKQSCGVSS